MFITRPAEACDTLAGLLNHPTARVTGQRDDCPMLSGHRLAHFRGCWPLSSSSSPAQTPSPETGLGVRNDSKFLSNSKLELRRVFWGTREN